MITPAFTQTAARIAARITHVASKSVFIPTRLQLDLLDIAIWAGTILPVLFFLQYTFAPDGDGKRRRWWRTAGGRAFVAGDVAWFLIFAPDTLLLLHPHWVFGIWHEWLDIGCLLAVQLVILYRCLSLEYGRRLRRAVLKAMSKEEEVS